MPKKNEESELAKAFRDLKPGGRYDIKTSNGEIVATLGVPAPKELRHQGTCTQNGTKERVHSEWLD